MSDYGRIHATFHNHRKVELAGNAAIGLWCRGISFCKAHHTAGHIKTEDALTLGTREEIAALVDAGLWEETPLGFHYRDWEEWNGDERPKSRAGRMVWRVIPTGHPEAVKNKLATKVADLLDEGIEPRVLERALKKWAQTPNASVGLLPFLVSDLARDNSDDFVSVIDAALKSGDISEVVRRGYSFVPPDPPAGASVGEIRAIMRDERSEWLRRLRREVLSSG